MKAWLHQRRHGLILLGLFALALVLAPCLAERDGGARDAGAQADDPDRWILGPSDPLPEVRARPEATPDGSMP